MSAADLEWAEKRRAEQQAHVERLVRELSEVQESLDTARGVGAYWVDRCETLRAELATVTADRDEARAELASMTVDRDAWKASVLRQAPHPRSVMDDRLGEVRAADGRDPGSRTRGEP